MFEVCNNLLSQSWTPAQIILLGRALRRKMPLTHMKKALAMQRCGSPAARRGGKQLANYHSLLRCDVLLPIPPFRLYSDMQPLFK